MGPAQPDHPGQFDGRTPPVELEVGRPQLLGVGRLARLGHRHRQGADAAGQQVDQHGGADGDQAAPELFERLVADRQLAPGVEGAGVEALVHRHHADPGHRVAGQDRPLDRGGAPPSGQQREVEVQHGQRSSRTSAG